MSRKKNMDSEFYIPVYHFDPPSYGEPSTKKPFLETSHIKDTKETVIVAVLIFGVLAFFIIKLLVDRFRQWLDSTDGSGPARTSITNADSFEVPAPNQQTHPTRGDARETSLLNGFQSYRSSDPQLHVQNLNSSRLHSHQANPQYRSLEQVHGQRLDSLRMNPRQDSELDRSQSHRAVSPAVRPHLRDDVLRVDQQSNRSVSCHDLPPSYDMIGKCNVLGAASSCDRADSGPAVLELIVPPSYTDAIRSQEFLSADWNEIELFSNESERESERFRRA